MLAALGHGATLIAAADTDPAALLRLEISREFLEFVGAEMTAMAERWEMHREAFVAARNQREARGGPQK